MAVTVTVFQILACRSSGGRVGNGRFFGRGETRWSGLWQSLPIYKSCPDNRCGGKNIMLASQKHSVALGQQPQWIPDVASLLSLETVTMKDWIDWISLEYSASWEQSDSRILTAFWGQAEWIQKANHRFHCALRSTSLGVLHVTCPCSESTVACVGAQSLFFERSCAC